MQEREQQNTQSEELSIPLASRALRGLVKGADPYDPEGLARAISRHLSVPQVSELIEVSLPRRPKGAAIGEQTDVSTLSSALSRLAKTPGSLEDFAHAFAERVFLSGHAKPARVQDATYKLLRETGTALIELRELPQSKRAPRDPAVLQRLRALDRALVHYVASSENIKSEDYSVLNTQHRVIGLAIRHEEERFLEAVPKRVQKHLYARGPVLLSEVSSWGKNAEQHIKKLLDLGIIHQSEIPGVGAVVAFARATVTPSDYEQIIPPRVRESIGEALRDELRTKYSGKLRPLGIAENREDGVPTLNDRLRLHKVSQATGVSVAHLVLALKYLEQHDLVRVLHTGFIISPVGNRIGLGMRAVRIVQRSKDSGGPGTDQISLDRYLDAVKEVRASWKSPTYTLKTPSGAAPWVYLLDELYAGNARIDGDLLKLVVGDIRNNPEALVVASNMFQGDPAVEPRASRTSIRPERTGGLDLRDYPRQLSFVRDLLASLGHPTLVLQGKNDLETANLRADVQRVRDQFALQGIEKPDEAKVETALSRVNDITYRAGRKFNAKLHAEILEFMTQVVMPLEVKLGRELMDSETVRTSTGLDMNEIEIIRDIAGELLQDRQSKLSRGRERVSALYGEFLELEQVGPEYLDRLSEVLFPETEQLLPGEPVARGGSAVQFVSANGQRGLSMVCLPEYKFGIADAINPTVKLIETIKARTLAGRDMPDIVVTGATGQSFVSMTAGGTLIVSAASLQASNFDDAYFFTESQDKHKRRRTVHGSEASAGAIAFQGGVDEGVKTDAYTLRLWNGKIREVLEENARIGRPKAEVEIFATSDWQVGSPTSKPATMLRGLFWAVMTGKKEIVINGDAFQGQNYGRAPAEMQLTGLIGIEDQQAFVHALLEPVLKQIGLMKRANPEWEVPKFKILAGNHETNSQSGKGLQGIWFLQTIAAQVRSFYLGAFGPEVAESHVLYPKKFVDRMGVDVDYSHLVLDHTDTTGFRIGVQHYVGAGAKGSTAVPPINAAKIWARSMENELRPLHGFLMGHWHTQSVTMSDGLFHVIFGANADKSGFEWHLGYPTTVPASGVLRLSSHRPPEVFFVTDPYLRLQEERLMNLPEYRALVDAHGSLEDFVEATRARHQRRDQMAMRYEELKLEKATHRFIESQRRLDDPPDYRLAG